ncbi:MAG: hypothetical protein LBS95_01050 [Mycoplasmataceae bacterium]|nr:hypothetical protein [Mycoplasmataceae bacterium]
MKAKFESSFFIKNLYVCCIILNIVFLLITLIVGLILRKYNIIYASLLFIPFGFLYIYITDHTSKLIKIKNNLNSFKRFSIFFLLSLFKYFIYLLPLLVTCILYNKNIFNLIVTMSETISFLLLLVIVSLIKNKEKNKVIN